MSHSGAVAGAGAGYNLGRPALLTASSKGMYSKKRRGETLWRLGRCSDADILEASEKQAAKHPRRENRHGATQPRAETGPARSPRHTSWHPGTMREDFSKHLLKCEPARRAE